MAANKELTLVKKAHALMRGLKNRPADRDGNPGGLVTLPQNKKILLIGDLHANLENLTMILEHTGNYRNIKSGKCLLIILGDAVHNDQPYQMKETAGSLAILEYLCKLIVDLAPNIIYIRGNHDTFDEQLAKNSIRQGFEFKKYLLEQRGPDYVAAADAFFEDLPLFIIGKGFVVTHAGPVRGGTTRQELINIRLDRDLYSQLLWNRVHEFRGTPNSKEYGPEDIKATLEKLGLPPETHFIVGHNPLWNTGNTTGIWMDVLGIRNHHILYSGGATQAPYLVFEGGQLIVKYSKAPRAEAIYV